MVVDEFGDHVTNSITSLPEITRANEADAAGAPSRCVDAGHLRGSCGEKRESRSRISPRCARSYHALIGRRSREAATATLVLTFLAVGAFGSW
jgi:hypothetical protein